MLPKFMAGIYTESPAAFGDEKRRRGTDFHGKGEMRMREGRKSKKKGSKMETKKSQQVSHGGRMRRLRRDGSDKPARWANLMKHTLFSLSFSRPK